jgi:NAD(P)-dependent dehydrogenase (short-subunit alcohol dehydrogenase family)
VSARKTAIITGASQGIGAGLVEAFLMSGYNVVATSRNATKSLNASPSLVLVDGDIGKPETAAMAVEAAIQQFGSIDVLVNNAGIFSTKRFTDFSTQDFNALVSTNLGWRSPEAARSNRRWFVWRAEQTEPVQLVAGGSGIVPLMSMIRSHATARSTSQFRLLYSVRKPEAVFYRDELQALSAQDPSVTITYAYTRATPKNWPRPAGRIDAALIAETAWPANLSPTCYLCGPTSFVETATGLLIAAGIGGDMIKTERFGPTGDR